MAEEATSIYDGCLFRQKRYIISSYIEADFKNPIDRDEGFDYSKPENGLSDGVGIYALRLYHRFGRIYAIDCGCERVK